MLKLVAVPAAGSIEQSTKIGRYIFAIGSNKEATRLSGVTVVKWVGMAYVIGGLSAWACCRWLRGHLLYDSARYW